MCVTPDDDPQKEENIITYYQVVNYQLEKYTTDVVTDEAEAKITSFKQPEYMSTIRYLTLLRQKLYAVVVFMKLYVCEESL